MRRSQILTTLLVVSLLGGGYLLLNYYPSTHFGSLGVQGDSASNELPAQSREVPEGWSEYKSERYRFSFLYPTHYNIGEYDEGGGASTFTVQSVAEAKGLQIFIVPYAEPTISEQRFLIDAPSGVRTNVEDTMLDGVRAVTFNSYDQFLGETRELWVVNGGYLYEIMTFRSAGDWFTAIISTWQFL